MYTNKYANLKNKDMHKKKIIFSDNTLWAIFNFRGNVIKHFTDKGYEVIVIAPEMEESEMQGSVPDGIRLIQVKMERAKTNPFSDIAYFFRVLRIYHKEKPVYIFHYTIKPNIYGSIAAKLNGVRSSAMMAGLGYAFKNDSLVSKIARGLYKIGMKCTENLFLLNKENLSDILRLKISNPKKITLLKGGEGVDLKHFGYTDNSSDDITFLFIGRILFEKGYNEFVECAKQIKKEYANVRFEILGTLDPTYPNSVSKERLEEDVQSGTICYAGFVKDVRPIYARKGIVVTLPSFYGEGLNRSLMEACATGKPIITTDIAGCRETVEDGINGYCIPPKDSNALIEAVRKYMNLTDEQRKKMSEASRMLAEKRFDIDNVIDIYDRII